jgi:hypothetical protein
VGKTSEAAPAPARLDDGYQQGETTVASAKVSAVIREYIKRQAHRSRDRGMRRREFIAGLGGAGKPCVVGCEALSVDDENRLGRLGDATIAQGDWVSIDGGSGRLRF